MRDCQQTLLKKYRSSGSDEAFSELVQGCIHLVYSTAHRIAAGDAHLAEDITQTVFADLFRKADRLPNDVLLSAWLHRHTFYVASTMIRTEQRRRRREQEAVLLNEPTVPSNQQWEELAPCLDRALNELPDKDRRALLLRFFEKLDLRRVGEQLGTSEDAAQKRVSRALEKLRSKLSRRGLELSVSGLASLLFAHAVSAAPALLSAKTAAAVIGGTAAGTGLWFTLQHLINMNVIKPIAGIALAAGIATPMALQHRSIETLQSENTRLAQQSDPLAQLQEENKRLAGMAADRAELERLRRDQRELLQLRGQSTLMAAELEKLKRELERHQRLLEEFREEQEEALTEEEREARRQVLIESRWFELPVDSPAWNELGLVPPGANSREASYVKLDSATAQELSDRLSSSENTKVMFTPRVTTLNGRQTQIKSVDNQIIVTGLKGEKPIAEPMEFGPILDLFPSFEKGTGTLQLTAIATLNQFLGYDDPGFYEVDVPVGSNADPLPEDLPLPRFGYSQFQANAKVSPGEVLVMAGGYHNEMTSPHNGLNGLIVFIHPAEIDRTGNPIALNKE